MRCRRSIGAFICVLALAGCGAAEVEPGPVAAPHAGSGLFHNGGYAKAKVDADLSGRFFLVDAVASWCKPCHYMDKTTWKDERVIAWLNEHAVIVKLDVDADKPRAREFRINQMPTVIVFKAGREIERAIGYRSADQMLTWLDSVRQREG